MEKDGKHKIGELLVGEGVITTEQLNEALEIQRNERGLRPLGNILIGLKFISNSEFRRVLRKHKKDMPIGELLVNTGIISPDQLSDALREQQNKKEKIGKILVAKGFATEAALLEAVSIQLGYPLMSPNLDLIDKSLLNGINLSFLKKWEALPAFKDESSLTVIMADPLNQEIITDLERFFQCSIEPAIAKADEITAAIDLYARKIKFGPEFIPEQPGKDLVIGNTSLLKSSADNIVEVVNFIISNAIIADASDIHIEPQEKHLRVRYRIDGILVHKTDLPRSLGPSLISRIKVLCGLDIAERRRHQDGRIEARIFDKEIDLRISTYAAAWGESVVIRILQRQTSLIDLSLLGFSPANLEIFLDSLNAPTGIILATGPTGSGKTTTLYASIQYLNEKNRKIITAEDPIEYTIEGVIQAQLDFKLGHTYMDFLKSMMRQDPDVIMIGEIRDQKTAEAVIQAALTGHKVLTTFHTDDTAGALLRLMNMGIETFLISSTVVSVVAQRLVRVLCNRCKKAYVPDKATLSAFRNIFFRNLNDYVFYKPVGCPMCNYTGYRGRTGIHELLGLSDSIRDAILARSSSGQIRTAARNDGAMISMREDGFYKISKGITSFDEVIRISFYNEIDDLLPRSAEEVISLCERQRVSRPKVDIQACN